MTRKIPSPSILTFSSRSKPIRIALKTAFTITRAFPLRCRYGSSRTSAISRSSVCLSTSSAFLFLLFALFYTVHVLLVPLRSFTGDGVSCSVRSFPDLGLRIELPWGPVRPADAVLDFIPTGDVVTDDTEPGVLMASWRSFAERVVAYLDVVSAGVAGHCWFPSLRLSTVGIAAICGFASPTAGGAGGGGGTGPGPPGLGGAFGSTGPGGRG